MFVVTRPFGRDYREQLGEQWQLRCATCGKAFRTLTECYLCYVAPKPGARSEATFTHQRCAVGKGGAAMRLVRSDFALRRVLEPLVTPIPPAALQDLPRTKGRLDWGSE